MPRIRWNDFSKRFWSHVENQPNGCWLWTSGTNEKGYGRFYVRARGSRKTIAVYAHRLAWFLKKGFWPKDCLLHNCDTPNCVRPSHLIEGTRLDNNEDCKRKGRIAVGERRWNAKLSVDKVRRMRQLRKQGQPLKRLASVFGVVESSVSQICNGKNWRHA